MSHLLHSEVKVPILQAIKPGLWPCSLHRGDTTSVPTMALTPYWEEQLVFTWHTLPRSFRITASAITETTEACSSFEANLRKHITELPFLRYLKSWLSWLPALHLTWHLLSIASILFEFPFASFQIGHFEP